MNKFNFGFRWIPVRTADGDYLYPQPLSSYIRNWYGSAAVYRWVVRDSKAKWIAVYYGECEVLFARLQAYLRPSEGTAKSRGQLTNLRLRAEFQKQIAAGCSVALEVLEFQPFQLNGIEFHQAGLSKSSIRKVIENLFIAGHDDSGVELLNRSGATRVGRLRLTFESKPSAQLITRRLQAGRSGVIATIIESLADAKMRGSGLTVEELVQILANRFADRSAERMAITVRAQLSRLPKERGIAIKKLRENGRVRYMAE